VREPILLAAPLLIGAVVLACRFIGCNGDSFGGGTPEPYSTAVMNTPGLVSFWRLNETSGAIANDSTDGNLGHYENGVTLGVPSQVNTDTDNTAALFDGISQYVAVGFAANINPPVFTVEAILNPATVDTGNHAVISSLSGDAANPVAGYVLSLEGASFQAQVGTGTAQLAGVTVPADAVAQGGPYYLAMVFDGVVLTLYVNPVDQYDPGDPSATVQQQASAEVFYAPNAQSDLLIGASNFPGPDRHAFFAGVINDVAVYDTALDFATIQSHYLVMLTGWQF
jgi:Concanavalin A-like lectin/glucanases superfamily